MKKLIKEAKEWFQLLLPIILVLIILFIGIRWDIYRWHTFQKETGSDIGYLKWHLVIDNKNK